MSGPRAEPGEGAGRAVFSPERFTRKVVLFAYGFFLLYLFRNDMLRHYVGGAGQVAAVAAAVVLIVLAVAHSSLSRAPRRGGRAAAWALLHVLLLAPVAWGFASYLKAHGFSGHDHQHGISFAALAGKHDAEALRRPGPGDVTLEVTSEGGAGAAESRTFTPLNLLELNILLEGGGEDFVGDRVAVRGMVRRDGKLCRDEFLLVRYVVGCCAAHAEPVAAAVDSPDGGKFGNGQWVTVYGQIQEHREEREGGHEDEHEGEHEGEHEEEHEEEHEHEGKHEHKHEHAFCIRAEKIEPTAPPPEQFMSRWNARKPFRF